MHMYISHGLEYISVENSILPPAMHIAQTAIADATTTMMQISITINAIEFYVRHFVSFLVDFGMGFSFPWNSFACLALICLFK